MGHTRLTTKGDQQQNENNHPFESHCNTTSFALAHNGIITNDHALRYKYHLSNTEIETDSYVAVQLLERSKALNHKTIRTMSEAIRGSFCFTILDARGNLYLVKGNNPLAIFHDIERQVYIYASTEAILLTSCERSGLYKKEHLFRKRKHLDRIQIEEGDILKITTDGTTTMHSFKPCFAQPETDPKQRDHTTLAKRQQATGWMGYEASMEEELFNEGYTPDEIAELLYEYESAFFYKNHIYR